MTSSLLDDSTTKTNINCGFSLTSRIGCLAIKMAYIPIRNNLKGDLECLVKQQLPAKQDQE